MLYFIIQCRKIAEKFIRDEMTVYAAQASFFIVMAAFPFIMMLMTVVQLIPNLSARDVESTILALIPDVRQVAPLVQNIIIDLYTKSPATVLSVTIVVALWSASKGMQGGGARAEPGLRVPHPAQLPGEPAGEHGTPCSSADLHPVPAFLVFGDSIQSFLDNTFPIAADVAKIYSAPAPSWPSSCWWPASQGSTPTCPTATSWPEGSCRAPSSPPSAGMLFSYGFSMYFNFFSRFSYMYGSLTAIILLMLWIYFCICILFLGAEINCHLDRLRQRGYL